MVKRVRGVDVVDGCRAGMVDGCKGDVDYDGSGVVKAAVGGHAWEVGGVRGVVKAVVARSRARREPPRATHEDWVRGWHGGRRGRQPWRRQRCAAQAIGS
ncbi:hypothetical protein ABZP36_024842 [Zizania latifolia]